MAEADRQDLSDAPTRIADRYRRALGLRPPVPVRDVLESFAVVKEEQGLPVGADAIVIGLKVVGRKPTVIIATEANEARQRFTLAHELGHILIPWHIGTIVSHTLDFESHGDWIYREMEAEANRFASEFLIPRKWVATVAEEASSPGAAHQRIANDAQVSPTAAAFGLIRALPKGHVFAQYTTDGRVSYSGRSPDTLARTYNPGDRLDPANPFPLGTETVKIRLGGSVFAWAFFSAVPEFPEKESYDDWRETLDGILSDLRIRDTEAEQLKRVMSGVVGAANVETKGQRTRQIYAVLRQRFSAKEELARIVSHPRFAFFIAQRARTLAERNRR